MEEWLSLAKSGAGERGVFNRQGAIKSMPKRRLERLKEAFGSAWRRMLESQGINPCREIKLLSKQFCNLALGVIRSTDTWDAEAGVNSFVLQNLMRHTDPRMTARYTQRALKGATIINPMVLTAEEKQLPPPPKDTTAE